jgi:fucose permease
MLMNVATAALADRHGAAGPRAITEANAVAAWVGLTAPLLIGGAIAAGLGWRVASLAVVVVALALAVGLTRVHLTEPAPADERVVGLADTAVAAPRQVVPNAPLPRAFFVSLLAIVAAVGTEVSLNFWGAVLIAQNTGADAAVTTAAISVMIAGIAVGRTLGSPLTRRFRIAHLIYASLVIALAGFLVIWLAPVLPLAIAGLFLTGCGFALLFPLTSSLAIGHAAGQSDRAIALIAVVVGVTLGVAPFALGALSGMVGVWWGFAIVPLLIVVGLLATKGASVAPASGHEGTAAMTAPDHDATTTAVLPPGR